MVATRIVSKLADLGDVTGTAASGKAPVHDGTDFALTDVVTQAEGDAAYARQLPAVVASQDPRSCRAVSALPDANLVSGVRVIVPRTGTLKELSVYVDVQAGNVDGAVYSTAGTRVRLWSSGSMACPAAGWRSLGDPDLAVTAGDQLDFALAADTLSSVFLSCSSLPGVGQGQLPDNFWTAAGGALPKLYWYRYAFPAPATILEADVSAYNFAAFVMARVV